LLGEIVSLGVSPTFNGYHGVIRRTVRAGEEPSLEQRKFIKAVEDLYVTVMEAIKESAKENLPSNYILIRKGKSFWKGLSSDL